MAIVNLGETYHCKKLHALISLEACEANRKKPQNVSMSDYAAPIMPSACLKCTDWMEWGKQNKKKAG